MLIKLIACEVFTREVCYCVARSPHVVDLEFTPKGAHNDPNSLRRLLQAKIDTAAAVGKPYDAIALCLGLCGNSTVGLVSPGVPLVMPRVHDCCALFLGSRQRFQEHFAANPSTPFSSVGYLEHGGDYAREADDLRQMMGHDRTFDDYVREYGEQDARYIWETIHPPRPAHQTEQVVFIEIPELGDRGLAGECRRQAEADGKQFVKLTGSIELIRQLVFGEWTSEDFLQIQPGESIAGVYDLDEVIQAKPIDVTINGSPRRE